MRFWVWLALLAPISMSSAWAQQKAVPPPAEWAGYFAEVRKADEKFTDLEQRCLAYPDLPGAEWPEGAGKGRCALLRSPPYTLSQMETLLDQPGGATQLDQRFASLLEAHYLDPAQRDQIFIAYHVFDASSQAERVAARWLTASPKSIHAKMASGKVLARQGWRARGGQYVRDTPGAKLLKMEEYFLHAASLLSEVLGEDARMLPACVELAAIGRVSSEELQQGATAACLQADPISYFVVEEMASAAEPKWGGSQEAMRAVAAYAAAHAKKNPMLYILTTQGIAYEADNSSDWGKKLADMLPATKLSPNANFLREVGTAYVTMNEDWKALVYLSQALRFSPHYAQQARLRASLLIDLGYPEWALADARRAVQVAPSDGHAQFVFALALLDTDGEAAARPHFLLAMGDPATREAAYPNYCRSFLYLHEYEKADICTSELTEEFPLNGEAWNLRAWSLDERKDPRFMHAVEQFLKYKDLQRWPNQARVAAALQKRLSIK
ncbi:hypothetical protein IP90_00753 [Luteimonas cucumeris]|uniref:Uncharacterized protein n=1 Tax=Luteimonas cucumeris TaxID=985012 RepID=A0A562LAF8_9GAMM|nr:hypothetical protein [Luteimonas cucumeris]TWI04620.1 hypothetical protein IP90_00753 [Luteimonas cucumeris]